MADFNSAFMQQPNFGMPGGWSPGMPGYPAPVGQGEPEHPLLAALNRGPTRGGAFADTPSPQGPPAALAGPADHQMNIVNGDQQRQVTFMPNGQGGYTGGGGYAAPGGPGGDNALTAAMDSLMKRYGPTGNFIGTVLGAPDEKSSLAHDAAMHGQQNAFKQSLLTNLLQQGGETGRVGMQLGSKAQDQALEREKFEETKSPAAMIRGLQMQMFGQGRTPAEVDIATRNLANAQPGRLGGGPPQGPPTQEGPISADNALMTKLGGTGSGIVQMVKDRGLGAPGKGGAMDYMQTIAGQYGPDYLANNLDPLIAHADSLYGPGAVKNSVAPGALERAIDFVGTAGAPLWNKSYNQTFGSVGFMDRLKAAGNYFGITSPSQEDRIKDALRQKLLGSSFSVAHPQ